jgi:hypothetical protein
VNIPTEITGGRKFDPIWGRKVNISSVSFYRV